ncbi:hypothetical protein DXG01_016628 [Tephrocybe rancida]|nr:hypothetical protein DXG01_016628 [Tephrocybe rancida]
MSRLLGWAPVKEESDHADASVPHTPSSDLLSGLVTFQVQSTKDCGTRPSSPEAPSPAASSDSSLYTDNTQPSSDIVRRGDPAWVARPRNAFIIFRCDYSRKHTKEGKRVRRPPGTVSTEKTLSKRAGEAWRLLSAQERKPYEERAEQEKEQHARMHPNYRYRPAKRSGHKRKNSSISSRSNSQSLIAPPVEEAEVIAPIPRYPFLSATGPPPPPLPPADMAEVKARHRRSASVPALPVGGIFQYVPTPKAEVKRPVSAMGSLPPSLALDCTFEGQQSYDPQMIEQYSASGYFTPQVESLNTVQHASPGMFLFPSQYSPADSPISQSHLCSSLASWNGEGVVTESSSPWSSSPLAELQALQQPQDMYSEYIAPSSDASLAEVMATYTQDDHWPAAPTDYSHASLGLDSAGALFSPTSLYNANATIAPGSSYTLDEYAAAQVMEPRDAIQNSEQAMFALDLNSDYFQYSQ